MKQLPSVPVKMDYFALKGGLNLTAPPLTMPPGFAIEALNFECDINGGYSRTYGYERVDGRSKPSDAVFYTIPCSTSGTWALGDTVTGADSGATATYLATSSQGLIVTKVTGTFQAEVLNAGAGTATGAQFAGGAGSLADAATYQNLAADVYRALITAVPGSGSILGVFEYGDVTYAFRNTSNATTAGMYKSSAAGWVAVHETELTFTSGGTYVLAANDVITGATSASTATVTRVVVRSGSFAGGDAAGTLTVVSQTTPFVAENLDVGLNLNVATIAADTQTVFGREMSFTSGGTYKVQDGDIITGATSTKTATVARVVLESGSWAAGTAAGRFIFTTDSGSFTAAETLNVGANIDVATVTGPSTAITFIPGGKFEFDVHNFSGDITTERVYGCDTKNRGFEFDGTTMVPIATGMAVDTPTHVIVHNEQLFFSFGTSNQHSGIARPYVWNVILGAGEIAVGDTVTGYMRQPGNTGGGSLLIATRNRAYSLYGNNASDWVLTVAQEDAGALPYTMQHLGGVIALDDRGVTYIGASQNYGNFEQNTITGQILPWIRDRRNLAVASCRVREKNQYRLFLSDAEALYITMRGNKVVGMLPVELNHTPTCASSTELSDGSEAIYFGATNGYVYQMEKGTSHDGDPINWSMLLSYNNLRSPQINKRYRKMAVEMTGQSYAEFSLGYRLGYNNANIPQPSSSDSAIDFVVTNDWDSFIWDNFFWDGQTLLPEELSMDGSAENVAILVTGSSDEFEPFTITGVLLHYTPRTRIR
jgi:hypothetical protein